MDFTQAANEDPTLGVPSWINGILNPNNSEYFEGVSTLQRVGLLGIGDTSDDMHTMTFSHQAKKQRAHAYDFLSSWDQAVAAADVIAPGSLDATEVEDHACDPGPSSPADFQATCTALHAGANIFDVSLPDDMDGPGGLILGDSVNSRISAYESFFGDRTLRLYGDQPITSASISFDGYAGTNMNATYSLTWESASTDVLIEFAGHLAQGQDFLLTGVGYGVRKGAGSINGGPYHVFLHELDEASLGSQDNQIQTKAIEAAPNFTIEKTGDDLSKIGDDVTYTFTLTHTGESDSPDLDLVSLTDNVLGNLADDLASQAPELLTLSPGESGSFQVSYTVLSDDPDPLINIVTATYEINDNGISFIRDDSHSLNLFQPEITITKTGDRTMAFVGDTITYSFEVENTGSDDSPALANVVVTDDNGTPGVPGDDFSPTFVDGDTDGDSELDKGEIWTYTAARTVLATDFTPLINTVTVHSNPAGFPNDITDDDSFEVEIIDPGFRVDKTGDAISKATDPASYTITVTNTSSGDSPDLVNPSIEDDLLGDLLDPANTFVTDITGDTNDDSILGIGEVWVISATRIVLGTDADPLVNTVTASFDVDGFSATLAPDADSVLTHTVDLFRPGVTVRKTLENPPDPLIAGDTITFKIEITNLSDGDLNTPELDDPNGNTPDLVFDAVNGIIDALVDPQLPDGGKVWDLATAAGLDRLSFGETGFFLVDYVTQPSDFPDGLNVVSVLYHPEGFPNDVAATEDEAFQVRLPVGEGRMTGGGSIFLPEGAVPAKDVRVTHGFQLHCAEPTEEINNRLEINWGKPSSRFHLETLTSAICTDDAPVQAPPTAPIDTFIGEGVGRFSGNFGGERYRNADATVAFIFTDGGPEKGEPGIYDTAEIVVTVLDEDQNGTADDPVVVLDTLGAHTLTFGNHQSHPELKRLTSEITLIQRDIDKTLDQFDNPKLRDQKILQLTEQLLDLFGQLEAAAALEAADALFASLSASDFSIAEDDSKEETTLDMLALGMLE